MSHNNFFIYNYKINFLYKNFFIINHLKIFYIFYNKNKNLNFIFVRTKYFEGVCPDQAVIVSKILKKF